MANDESRSAGISAAALAGPMIAALITKEAEKAEAPRPRCSRGAWQ